ncbi:TIGR01212 family radical SAM protein, partial [Clostridium perfringens]|nr:TIGR01212 family radical SAM protein [Clostridium perfringens]
SLDGGFTCPNRDGKVAKGGCTFCSARGSGDFAGSRTLSITKQFEDRKDMMEKKWKDGKLIAYFQAYTNTYAPVEELRRKYREALEQKNVVAISIATRPDCIDDDVLDFLTELNKETYLIVELGLQTINDETARNFNRGYD